MMTLRLNGDQLTIEAIRQFLATGDQIEISEEARERVKRSRAIVDALLKIRKQCTGLRQALGYSVTY